MILRKDGKRSRVICEHTKKLLFGLVLILGMSNASHVYADCMFQKGDHEWGILSGYGHNFPSTADILRGKNVTEDVQFIFLIPYWGKVIKEWNGCWSLEFITETFLTYAIQESKSRYAVGVTPLFQFNFKKVGRVTPFINLGSGVLYTNLDPEGFGSEFDFTPQIGTGVRYQMGHNRFLTLSYRFHHISNANTVHPNESIDSNFFIIGISVKK